MANPSVISKEAANAASLKNINPYVTVFIYKTSLNEPPPIISAENPYSTTPKENNYLKKIKNHKKINEYIKSRILVSYAIRSKSNSKHQKLTFSHTKSGRLIIDELKEKLFFSLSHCPEGIAFSLSTKSPVGIDLEYIRSSRVSSDTAELFMHPDEFTLFNKSNCKVDFFYKIWGMKEAWFKSLPDSLQKNFNFHEQNTLSVRKANQLNLYSKKVDNMMLAIATYAQEDSIEVVFVSAADFNS